MTAGSDDYVKVQGKARHVSDNAVLFSVGDSVSRGAWIPRSLVHGADDLVLRDRRDQINRTGANVGTPLVLRIRRWKAEEVGFTGDADDQTADLFTT